MPGSSVSQFSGEISGRGHSETRLSQQRSWMGFTGQCLVICLGQLSKIPGVLSKGRTKDSLENLPDTSAWGTTEDKNVPGIGHLQEKYQK